MKKNVIIFGADMGLLVHIDSKKYVFIFGKGPIDGLTDTTLTAEKEYCKNFALVWIIIGWIVIYLLIILKYVNFIMFG